MSRKIEKKILPSLRFREFTEEGRWESIELNAIAELIDERAGSNTFTTMSVTSGVGLISQKEKFGREISGSQYKNYYVLRKWDFAYNKSATKQYPEGYISMLKDLDAAAVPNSIFTCFRVNRKKVYPDFLNYLFHDNFHGKWLRKFIEVGARAHGSLNIDNEVLFKMPVFIPEVNEQQKIADCLSSLDELITAENQKLEALKAHKKGLVQKLFPTEGEKVPKLRFKEFGNSGEWEEKPLEEIAMFLKGKGISKSDISVKGVLPCIRYGELYTHYREVIDSIISLTNLSVDELMLSEANDVIIPSSGETREDIATASCVLRGGVALGGDLNILRSKINGVFLAYYLTHVKKGAIAKLAQGDAVVHLYSSQLKKLVINFPKRQSEQQKIAECFSSLDNSITTQSKKIESLKTHKKGLMQQLFPTASDIEE